MNANDPNTKSDPISAPPRFGEWLPIETALRDRDADEILAAHISGGQILRKRFVKWHFDHWRDEMGLELRATHWMILPEPPR